MGSDADKLDGGIFPRGFSSETSWPWQLVKAGDLVQLNYGKALQAGSRRHGPVPVYGTNGQCGWHDIALSTGPGVILGRKGQGPLGVEWCDSDFWVIDTAYFVTRKTEHIDLKYFYHLIKYIGLNHLKDGTSNPSLSRDTFAVLLLPVPPLKVQEAIADILGTLDDKIELNRRMNEALEGMARAMFKSWFVDFDPVHAKAKGHQPEGMDAETAKLFPSSFQESEVGPVPKGWHVQSIGECVTVVGGSTPSTGNPSFWNGTHCFCTPKDLSALSSHVLLDTERKITDEGVEQISSGLLPPGAVLLSSRAPIGYLVMADVPTTVNQGFIAMICDKSLPNHYVLRWAEINMDLIKGQANGTTFMEVSKAAFRPIPAIVPPVDTLTAFVEVVENLHSRVVCNLKENTCLARARDALLPRLLSGELRLAKYETLMEAV